MYSLESLKKVVKLMNETIDKYSEKTVDEIKLCISSGNRKIGRVMNVSLPPIVTCSNCKECKFFCYDVKACLQYPDTVIDARIRNYMVFKKDINTYFQRIDDAMNRRRKNKFFRWHVAGDIINYDYFSRMVENAKNHPDFIIWTYTKNYNVVNKYVADHGGNRFIAIPHNFTIMFSEWDGMPLNNPYNFPVFSVKMKNGNKNHGADYFNNLYKCPGNCDVCKAARRGCPYGETVYADEH